jgi:predicted ATPase
VTFLIGENGTGKSTLLEAIAVKRGFNPEGGSRGVRFSTYESHSSFTGWEATASTSSTSRRLPSRRRGS